MVNNDFEATNVEFIEFWMLSPFLDPNSPGDFSGTAPDQQGTLYINIGNVSEDVLKDSELAFENGLPGPPGTISSNRQYLNTEWGRVPSGPIITEAFDNDPESRSSQDIGLDGLTDMEEAVQFAEYLNKIQGSNLLDQAAKDRILDDPANDNFQFFTAFPANLPVIEKYKSFSKPQGNSPVNQSNNLVASSRLKPDSEDLNDDKTLNEAEAYFQYEIPIEWDNDLGIKFNRYITDSVQVRNNQRQIYRIWYNFKIPIQDYDQAVGGIQDFRSIRFFRMYLKDFAAPVNLSFVDMKLTRSQWRRYRRSLKEDGVNVPDQYPGTIFDITDVGLEENSTRQPFNYVLPKGIQREQNVGGFQPGILQDERSLAIRLRDLRDGDARGVYKLTNLDLRVYERMKMFVHAETQEQAAQDGDLEIFIRVGSDFEDNYYEYAIPLSYSDPDDLPSNETQKVAYSDRVWLEANNFDFPLHLFTDLKVERNNKNGSLNYIYESVDPEKPSNRTRIIGNPDMGKIRGIMVGIRNPFNDGVPHTAEVWINELRMNGLDERGGVAGVARLDVQMADFGQVSASTAYSSIGYGGIEQKLAQRNQEEVIQYDFAGNFELGRFFNKDFGLKIPFLYQYSQTKIIPRFDPYTRDIEFKDLLDDIDPADRDSVYNASITQEKIQSINFSNVRKERSKGNDKKPMPWNIENFSVSYSLVEKDASNPQIEFNRTEDHYATLDYAFAARPFFWQPFKKLFKKDKYIKFLTEFNLNPVPSNLAFGSAWDRNYQVTKQRFAGTNPFYNTFYQKQFLWNRDYALAWDFTKSLKFNYSATNQAIIDELEEFDEEGNPRTQGELNDYIWENLQDFGRTKNFSHNFSLAYTLPFKYFPFLDFVNIRAQYNATYNWAGASLNALELGNVIQNTQKRDVNADINFEKLYNNSKYLKSINTPPRANTRPRSRQSTPDSKGEDRVQDADKDKDKKKNSGPSTIEKVLIRPLMLLRNARVRYSEDFGTTVPGFMPQAKFFGQNEGFTAPGWDFVAGLQPDDVWFNRAATGENGVPWITTNFFLNQKVQQNYSVTLDGKVTVEPFNDFRIDIDYKRRFTENHTELFKDADGNGTLERLLPQDLGSLELTYFTANTLFGQDPDGITLFNQFEANREVISQRVGVQGTEHTKDGGSYTEGYGKTQQNVLIPAFVAAYTGEDPNNVPLDVFKTIPRPNWTLNYNGLSKIPLFAELFSSFSLRHGYRSNMTINQYATNLYFDSEFNQNSPQNLNPETESFYSRLEIPNVMIREGFSPLIGIDVKTKQGVSVKLSYDKTRDLDMNLLTFQLSETQGSSINGQFEWTLKGVEFEFLQKGKKKKEEEKPDIGNQFLNRTFGGGRGQSNPQDLNIILGFQLQDNVTINHLLDKNIHEKIRGQYQLRINPSVDYQLNQRLNLRLFVDYTLTKPKTSITAPQTQINGGLTIQFELN
ncbi:MAG: cell surface protein SprA [Saprospiraceae bacterium]